MIGRMQLRLVWRKWRGNCCSTSFRRSDLVSPRCAGLGPPLGSCDESPFSTASTYASSSGFFVQPLAIAWALASPAPSFVEASWRSCIVRLEKSDERRVDAMEPEERREARSGAAGSDARSATVLLAGAVGTPCTTGGCFCA